MGLRSWIKRGLASPRIFISYRRSDAGGHAGRLQAELSEYYGPRAAWIDHAKIEPGEEFAKALADGLAQSDVLLAVIGPDWLTAEKEGLRRLDDPEDWVRREVAAGLAGRAVVTPVLVGHAILPTVEELPEPLQALPLRQAIEVRPERFEDDVEDLIRRIGGWRRRWRGFPLWAWALAVTAVAGLLLVALLVRRNMAPLIDPQQVEAVAGVPEEIDLLSWATDDRDGELTLIADPVSSNQGSVDNLGDGRVVYTA
ncbi:MAG TPA: toll/interleukin-1 receptor domain-containing protein, partial [Acidimicrobiia bacterium]|nr:toll/interleukin-1 receptor domain-containing protein [Acidimicrobiia bacterium]